MRCNSLYPAEGEPPPILATKRRRLNSHDRSHYLLPRNPWRPGQRNVPARIIFTDSIALIALNVFVHGAISPLFFNARSRLMVVEVEKE